ncbi:MAG TPA: hypothetical protein VMX54_15410 [Vicinamibacteria bacterium]|nr:hypothetical protein [Vicinamibacteria bacterium]
MIVVGLGLAFSYAVASADAPGRHPRYLHARSDLWLAHHLLNVHDEPNVMAHVHAVRGHIMQAIHEIDNASVIDRKNTDSHPPVDANLDRRGRFSKAMSLLASARRDISLEEDNPHASQWRDAAYRHIDDAMNQLRKAARDLQMDRMEGF